MTFFSRSALLVLLLLAACASPPKQQPIQAEPKASGGATNEKQPQLPNVVLSDDLLYEFLLGEVSLQRGQADVAADTYLDLARSTRDPRVARRAAQIAYQSRQYDKAVEALKLWIELDPGSSLAKQTLASILIAMGRLDEVRPLLAEMLAADPAAAGPMFQQIAAQLIRQGDKAAALGLARELAKPYSQVAEAHWAVAQVAHAAGKQDEALREVRHARELRPNWEAPALFEAQLLQAGQPEQALTLLKDFLASNPQASEARLFYARLLLERQQYKESRAQFQILLKENPGNAELAFAVALLSLQMGELDRAEKELKQALARGKKDQNTVYYYLGQLSEAKKDSQAALQYYRKVQAGEYVYPSQLRAIYLLNADGKLDDALDVLHRIKARNNQQRAQVLLIEVQLLRDAKRFEQAYRIVQKGLEQFPEQPDLLYEGALLADKLGKPDVLEQMMRTLIRLQPDNANAYNMLGYSFLDRNVHVEEGMRLVEKAYRMSPNDAAIMDSVGWGHYRLGNLTKSLEFLRRAFAANPDPEIAAHLGEVLWVHGNKDEAKKVWSDSLKQHPDSELLQAVMKKFLP